MPLYECEVGIGPPFPFQFPDEGIPVSHRGIYYGTGSLSDTGVFSCQIDVPDIVRIFEEGEGEWYFDAIDGRLHAEIVQS